MVLITTKDGGEVFLKKKVGSYRHWQITINKGVCHTLNGLVIYIKKYLKTKEELSKPKYFSMQKHNLQKIL
jgi:hypothetical protein